MNNGYPSAFANGATDKFLYNIFENLSVGLELYDKDGLMTEVNPAELESMGIKDKNDILGHNLFDHPDISPQMEKQIREGETVQFTVEYDFDSSHFFFPSSLSGKKYFEVTVSSVRNDENVITGFLLMSKDVTKHILWQHKYEKLHSEVCSKKEIFESRQTILQNELIRHSKVLSISLDALNAYTWYYDIENDRLTYGDGFDKIGFDPESLNTMDKFIAGIHPEDQERLASVFRRMIEKGEGSFSAEYRIDLHKNGNYIWRECRGAVETITESGVQYRYLFGMDINIEAHKNTELALLKSKEEMMKLIHHNELVLNNTNSGLAYIASDYVVQWENISLCSKSLSYEAYKKGEPCYKTAHNRTTPCENCVMQRARESGQVETIQFGLQNGHVIEVFATPVYNALAEIEGVVIRVDDVTERQHMIGELEKARSQAEQSDKLKSAFLANMSHEIRTPLNAIVGFSDLMIFTDDPEEKEEYTQIINTNNELLLKLINDILDLSKIEAGAVELKYEEFDLAVYFNELTTAMQCRVTNPKVQLVSVNPYTTCMVRLDKSRLAQIITNYVTNAIKYTPEGVVEMGYEAVDEGIRVYVRDTGIGIPEDKKNKVFNRFEKLDEFAQGTGLGLSICKAIIEACGGSIGFESEYGKGSLFWAVMPCITEDENERMTTSQWLNGKYRRKVNTSISQEKSKEEQKTILVVEDIHSNFSLVSSLLKNRFKLLHASNGKKAVEIVRNQPVDLILMDMKMPVMDGRTATVEIRKFNTRIPIVALTAHAFDSDRVAALESGCDDYLVKPINGAKLMQALKEYGC